VDLRLLSGHLGDPAGVSPVVNEIVRSIDEVTHKGLAGAYRLRGPSAAGKTKVCFDILKKRYGIYIDWSSKDADIDIRDFLERVTFYSKANLPYEQFEDWCKTELYVLIAGRLMALLVLLNRNQAITPEQWLLMQLNGLARKKQACYQVFLCVIRDYLRTNVPELRNFIEDIRSIIDFVIVQDEVNEISHVLSEYFLSATDSSSRRPLLSLCIKGLYGLHGVSVISSGTGKISDHFDYFRSTLLKPASEVPKRRFFRVRMR
jgi:hypothetical protein